MVVPVNAMTFRVGTRGVTSQQSDMVIVRDMETFNISFDNGIEAWNPLDQNGWVRRMMTSKSISISLSGKRNYLDRGNNYIASLAYENGLSTCTIFECTFPGGGTMRMECVINVTASDGGAASDVAALEFECLSDGMPIYTA